jgi:type IV pilus assembly protein PilF
MKQRWIPVAMLILAATLTACTEVPVKPKDKSQYAETPAKINAELGLGYMQQGDMKRAKEKLEISLRYNPDYEKAHHYIAELYRRLGDYDKADKHYRRAIHLAPDDSGLHNNYGAFLCERKQFQQAEEQFLMAVHDPLFNGRTRAYENLGLCAADAGEEAKAETYLRTALKADPKLAKSLFRMAELNYAKGDYLRARAYLERYQEVGPKTAESLWLGVRVEHHMGDREMMKRYAYELSRAFPDSEQWKEYTSKRW